MPVIEIVASKRRHDDMKGSILEDLAFGALMDKNLLAYGFRGGNGQLKVRGLKGGLRKYQQSLKVEA